MEIALSFIPAVHIILRRTLRSLGAGTGQYCKCAHPQKRPTCTNTCSRFKCCWLCSLALIILVAVIKRSGNCLGFFFCFFYAFQAVDKEDFMRQENVIVSLFEKALTAQLTQQSEKTMRVAVASRGSVLFTLFCLSGLTSFSFFFFLLHNLLARMHTFERVSETEAGRQDDFQCFLVGHWGVDKYSTCNNKWKRQRLSERLSSPLLSSPLFSSPLRLDVEKWWKWCSESAEAQLFSVFSQ